MFPKMRRKNQQLPQDECERILKTASYGVLGLNGINGYPYTVALNYVYNSGKIYFHCALQGYKIDCIKEDCRASFSVIGDDTVIAQKYTTAYRSVTAFGKVKILDDRNEILTAIKKITLKYVEDTTDMQAEIDRYINSLCILEMTVEHMTGKAGLESE